LTTSLEFVQVDHEATDVVITGESVLVHNFNNNLGLVAVGNGNSVIPDGVLTTVLADLSSEDVVTNDESAVGVHLTNDVGVVGKVGFNRLESDSAGHSKS